jgi:hypothetical protein
MQHIHSMTALVVAVVNRMKGRDWGMQLENKSGGDMTISIVYHLMAENSKIALLIAKNMRVVEYNSAAWLIAADKYVLRWLMVDLCILS